MGGGISAPTPETPSEVFALAVALSEFGRFESLSSSCPTHGDAEVAEDLSPALDLTPDQVQAHIESVYSAAQEEFETPLESCVTPAVIMYKYQHMAPEERREYENRVVDAITAKEKERLKRKLATKKETSEDFAKGFGGTEADSRAEKEAAALLRGSSAEGEDETDPLLRRPACSSNLLHAWLKKAGRWKKFPGADCVMYINVLSRDIGNRPSDYVEDIEETQENHSESADTHPSHGLPFCALVDLPDAIDNMLAGSNKTVLVLDPSAEQHAASYFSYKARMEDVSSLCIPFAKGGKKRQDVIEGCRRTLVAAMKTGSTFVLYLGRSTIEHADWKTKLCKKGVFPIEVFESSGDRLKAPPFAPRYKELFRDDELEHGEAILRDGFRVIVLSALNPLEFEAQLGDSIPLGYMQPLFVTIPK